MIDIVEKLRERPIRFATESESQMKQRRQQEREEGAREITALRAENERLRAALRWYAGPEAIHLYGFDVGHTARAAFLAIVEAWPGMADIPATRFADGAPYPRVIHLPFPLTEKTDAEA